MQNIENPIEFSALLTSLKSSVISSTLLLMEMLKDDKEQIEIDDEDSKNIIALLMYDSLVNESVKYSYLDDFDFLKPGKIILQNKNRDKVKSNLETMLEYLIYRIDNPIDLASC